MHLLLFFLEKQYIIRDVKTVDKIISVPEMPDKEKKSTCVE